MWPHEITTFKEMVSLMQNFLTNEQNILARKPLGDEATKEFT